MSRESALILEKEIEIENEIKSFADILSNSLNELSERRKDIIELFKQGNSIVTAK